MSPEYSPGDIKRLGMVVALRTLCEPGISALKGVTPHAWGVRVVCYHNGLGNPTRARNEGSMVGMVFPPTW